MYLLQIRFNLSDPATEGAIYGSYPMRKFTGIDFMAESVSDEMTFCKFRHLLEANGLNKLFFDAINRVMVPAMNTCPTLNIISTAVPAACRKCPIISLIRIFYIENRKFSARCKVEHAFRRIKRQFGYRKTVYRSLRKNENWLYAMFACTNLYTLAIAGRKFSTI